MNKIELLDTDLLQSPLKKWVLRWKRIFRKGLGWHYLLDIIWILKNLDAPPGAKILDAGAGQGLLQYLLAIKGYQVYSVDLSYYRLNLIRGFMIKFAKGRIRYYQNDLMALPFDNKYFDAVVSVSAIEHNYHFNDFGSIFDELERVTRKYGQILLTTSATNRNPWIHKPSGGWNYNYYALRYFTDIDENNFYQYAIILDHIINCKELKDMLSPFYFKSGENGMPFGKWEPQYIPVGIRKTVVK